MADVLAADESSSEKSDMMLKSRNSSELHKDIAALAIRAVDTPAQNQVVDEGLMGLPDDILGLITNKLDDVDTFALAQTCKAAKTLTNERMSYPQLKYTALQRGVGLIEPVEHPQRVLHALKDVSMRVRWPMCPARPLASAPGHMTWHLAAVGSTVAANVQGALYTAPALSDGPAALLEEEESPSFFAGYGYLLLTQRRRLISDAERIHVRAFKEGYAHPARDVHLGTAVAGLSLWGNFLTGYGDSSRVYAWNLTPLHEGVGHLAPMHIANLPDPVGFSPWVVRAGERGLFASDGKRIIQYAPDKQRWSALYQAPEGSRGNITELHPGDNFLVAQRSGNFQDSVLALPYDGGAAREIELNSTSVRGQWKCVGDYIFCPSKNGLKVYSAATLGAEDSWEQMTTSSSIGPGYVSSAALAVSDNGWHMWVGRDSGTTSKIQLYRADLPFAENVKGLEFVRP